MKGEYQKNPQFRPIEQLKVGGKFDGHSTYGDNYAKVHNVVRVTII